MSTKTIKLLVFIAILVHGIGHLQGVLSSLGVKLNKSTSYKSWLLKTQSERTNRVICFFLYLFTAIFGILAALSFKDLIISHTIWQTLMIITAVLSSLALILFPNALAMFFNKAGAIAVNLITYYSLVFNGNWPAAIFEE